MLGGAKPDRPPFSFWYHFLADQASGDAAVRAHLNHLHRYDLDFLKVMNDNPYPHSSGRIQWVEELASVVPLRVRPASGGS